MCVALMGHYCPAAMLLYYFCAYTSLRAERSGLQSRPPPLHKRSRCPHKWKRVRIRRIKKRREERHCARALVHGRLTRFNAPRARRQRQCKVREPEQCVGSTPSSTDFTVRLAGGATPGAWRQPGILESPYQPKIWVMVRTSDTSSTAIRRVQSSDRAPSRRVIYVLSS